MKREKRAAGNLSREIERERATGNESNHVVYCLIGKIVTLSRSRAVGKKTRAKERTYIVSSGTASPSLSLSSIYLLDLPLPNTTTIIAFLSLLSSLDQSI